MKSVDRNENELLRRVAFFARYEASTLGARQIEWPHLFLGLMREGRPVLRNFFGSHEACVGLGLKIRESLPSRPSVSTSVDIPMAADCEAFIKYAARQTLGQSRRDAPLEVLFVTMLKNQPDWFRQYGFDSEIVAQSFSYPPADPPAIKAPQLTGYAVVMLEFRGVLDEMEGALHRMPESRANQLANPGAVWSRKQLAGLLIDRASNQHQVCMRSLVSQDREISFPDYDPVAWVNAAGYQAMPWSVLMDLCFTYQRLLYDLFDRFPTEDLRSAVCRIGDKQPRPLLDLLREYVANLRGSFRELSR
jgi:hypothetical protein